ncbi:TRAP transporter large permease [Neobacillus niacini]|uniref:TRAP transporter large permease n=1 Tax=Neobacillus niacini TaxID=86668 RepID=UPI0030007363
MEVLIPIILLFILLIIGTPVGFTLAIVGAVGLYIVGGFGAVEGIFQTAPYRNASSFILTTIPMFMLMAQYASKSGITKEIFDGAKAWVGHFRGGLATASVIASAGIGAISGSSSATAAMMSSIAVPEMTRLGYDKKVSLGTVCSAGTLAIMIPPSTVLILYGILTEQSIGKLLLAGIIPGIIMTIAYVIVVWTWVRKNPELAPTIEKVSWNVRFRSLKNFWPVLVIAVIVLGGIYTGIMTATESAAIGSLGMLIIAKLFWKLSWKGIYDASLNAVRTTSMIFMIIIGAHIFGYFLTISRVTPNLIGFIEGLDVSTWVIFAVICILYLILGCFMDLTAILVLTLPLIFPITQSLGFDPIWFGIIITILGEIGLITPPLGLNVFVGASAAKVPVEIGFAGVWRFVIASLVVLIIIAIFPDLATWLPNQIK